MLRAKSGEEAERKLSGLEFRSIETKKKTMFAKILWRIFTDSRICTGKSNLTNTIKSTDQGCIFRSHFFLNHDIRSTLLSTRFGSARYFTSSFTNNSFGRDKKSRGTKSGRKGCWSTFMAHLKNNGTNSCSGSDPLILLLNRNKRICRKCSFFFRKLFKQLIPKALFSWTEKIQ